MVNAPKSPRHEGFALLITITLLAFLVLLLVSLSSLTRVETQVAANTQQLTQARQNALMALNIALGQLQKAAGPDQRITATADLAGDANGSRLAVNTPPDTSVGNKKYWDASGTDNGLTQVQSGTRYWTGVWGNSDPSIPTSGNGNIYEKAPRPVLINWLVSGNEKAVFSTPSSSTGESKGTAISYLPGMLIGNLTGATQATDTVTINNAPAVLLVGRNSAALDSANVTPADLDRYIAAPLVSLTSDTVPGIAGSQTIGRYAYWVGDEGVKARINLTDPYADKTDAASTPEARYRLMTAPRSGVEVVSDFSNSQYSNRTQSPTLSANTANHVLALPQAQMIDPTATTGFTGAKLAARFHDLTTSTTGVAADSYNGGLRKDLTALLEPNALATWTGTNNESAGKSTGIIPAAYSPTMATLATGDKRVPRWDLLNSFYNLPSASGNTLTGSASDTLEVRAPTDTQMGITPVVSQMRFMTGVRVDAANKQITALLNPLIVLSNPYPVKLKASGGLDFTIERDNRAAGWRGGFFGIGPTTSTNSYYYDLTGLIGPGKVFHIPGFTLQPGQSAVFSIKNKQAAGALVNLDSGFDSGAFQYVYAQTSAGAWNSPDPIPTQVKLYVQDDANFYSLIVGFKLPGATALLQQIGGININRNSAQYPSTQALNNSNDDRAIFVYSAIYDAPGVSPLSSYYANGIANSSLRSYADFNPRAGYYRFTRSTYFSGPYTQAYTNPSSTTLAAANSLAGLPLPSFTQYLASLNWGRDWTSGVTTAALFDIPRRASSAELPLLSLGAFQHANLAAEDIPSGAAALNAEFGSSTTTPPPNPGHQPAYAFGNSYANIYLPRDSARTSQNDVIITGNNPSVAANTTTTARTYYDISYLLNASLWDGYFCASIPSAGNAVPVNPRLSLRTDVSPASDAVLRNGGTAAAYTLIDGAFNVNSTSVDAWASLLAGMKNLPAIPGIGTGGNNAATVFARSLHQLTQTQATPTGTGDDSYSGFRQLSDQQIRDLATAITRQVRLRGPFLSLGQFVNRVLISATNGTEQSKGLGQSGALQAAIDGSGLNTPLFSDVNAQAAADKAKIPTQTDDTTTTGAGYDILETNGRGTNSIYADGANAGIPNQLQRSTAIPGWLTQADVLQTLGPVISARSDTFVIRTYGDVLNPATGGTTPTSRAWCEAVVQRLPDYVNTADPAETSPASVAKPENKTLGRRFKVISFRWLSATDI